MAENIGLMIGTIREELGQRVNQVTEANRSGMIGAHLLPAPFLFLMRFFPFGAREFCHARRLKTRPVVAFLFAAQQTRRSHLPGQLQVHTHFLRCTSLRLQAIVVHY